MTKKERKQRIKLFAEALREVNKVIPYKFFGGNFDCEIAAIRKGLDPDFPDIPQREDWATLFDIDEDTAYRVFCYTDSLINSSPKGPDLTLEDFILVLHCRNRRGEIIRDDALQAVFS